MGRRALLLALSLGLAGCGLGVGTDDDAPVLMRILAVDAMGGGMEEVFGSTLQSDVLFVDPETFATSIFPDTGRLTVSVSLKNPDPLLLRSSYTDVTLEAYQVRYVRTDGRNTQGVDVPFAISGPLGATISVGTTATVTFEVVRHAAKMEPPLMNLAVGTGDNIITCVAEITVYGRTASGRVVTDMARLQITFANFGNDTTA